MARSVDESQIGARINAAREAAGLNQGELAAELAIDRSAVNKIERGVRRVTAFELSEIARVLNRRMEWFLSDPTPAIVSHREREGTSRRAIDAALEEVARELTFVASVGGKLALREYETKPVPRTTDEAEALAVQVRTGLSAGQAPLTDLVAAAEQMGLLAFSQPLGLDSADGGSVLLEVGGVALVNSTADVGRRRMTLAHEIGHYVVADEYTIDHSVLLSDSGDREALLDRFARALLCPADAALNYWQSQRDLYESFRAAVLKSASYWRVDFATLARRLLDLGAIDAGQAKEVRGVRAVRADFVELDLHMPIDMENRSLPRSFELAVLALYRSETISSVRAVQLLRGNYDELDLPERRIYPESAAWQVIW